VRCVAAGWKHTLCVTGISVCVLVLALCVRMCAGCVRVSDWIVTCRGTANDVCRRVSACAHRRAHDRRRVRCARSSAGCQRAGCAHNQRHTCQDAEEEGRDRGERTECRRGAAQQRDCVRAWRARAVRAHSCDGCTRTALAQWCVCKCARVHASRVRAVVTMSQRFCKINQTTETIADNSSDDDEASERIEVIDVGIPLQVRADSFDDCDRAQQ
jgi:hypothetical protein